MDCPQASAQFRQVLDDVPLRPWPCKRNPHCHEATAHIAQAAHTCFALTKQLPNKEFLSPDVMDMIRLRRGPPRALRRWFVDAPCAGAA
eukprot:9413881-Pyramimonas_sp.AAC.1